MAKLKNKGILELKTYRVNDLPTMFKNGFFIYESKMNEI